MLRSGQRLGDNPQDYDGVFQGLDDERADVSGVRPDADFSANRPPPNTFKPWRIYPRPPPPHWHRGEETVVNIGNRHHATGNEEFSFDDIEIPDAHPWMFEIDVEGVYQVYENEDGESVITPIFSFFSSFSFQSDRRSAKDQSKSVVEVPSLREYFVDLDYILNVIADGPTKSFAFRRLKYLASKFTMYSLLNEFEELAAMKVSILSKLPSNELILIYPTFSAFPIGTNFFCAALVMLAHLSSQ